MARVAAGLAVAATLFLGPTAGPLATTLGLPMPEASCACPPTSCRCPHGGATRHADGAGLAAGADRDGHPAGRPSCPLRGGAGASGAVAAAADRSHGAKAHASHDAAARPPRGAAPHVSQGTAARASHAAPAHAPLAGAAAAHAPHAVAAAHHAHGAPPGTAAVPAATDHHDHARPAPAGCSIASHCGGDAPTAANGQAWLRADLDPGLGWAAPAGRGDLAPPAAAARLLDPRLAPEPPPPRRIAPIA